MPNALTLEHMSPGLWKVVETCNHEPHRRKSRMREIRSSGSGEGPGWVTARPTLQRRFRAALPAAHLRQRRSLAAAKSTALAPSGSEPLRLAARCSVASRRPDRLPRRGAVQRCDSESRWWGSGGCAPADTGAKIPFEFPVRPILRERHQ